MRYNSTAYQRAYKPVGEAYCDQKDCPAGRVRLLRSALRAGDDKDNSNKLRGPAL